MLRARAARRENPILGHVPDPVIGWGPEQEALLADSVGLALLVGPSRLVHGAQAVARQVRGFARFAQFARPVLVNGTPGLISGAWTCPDRTADPSHSPA